ncbi:hypothetical protein, partial [Actinocorallia lasiicapitis]
MRVVRVRVRGAVVVHVRGLVAVAPRIDDHHHAFRVALGLAVPGALLLAAGRPDLMIYSVFGAITGMYGRAVVHRRRLVQQAQAGTVLLAGVALGVLLAELGAATWALVATEVIFAGVVSLLTDRLGLKPEGPFFGLFALGAIASVPAGRVAPGAAVGI